MRVQTRARRREERGAAAVEFAIISVVFLTLVFGMIQYSLFFWSTQSAANAAREGARRGSVGQTCADLTANTLSYIKLRDNTPTITRRYYAATDTTFSTPITATNGANVRIVIIYNSTDLHFPFVPFFNNGAVRDTAVSRVENYSSTTPANWSNC
jgi:Flp pilus assembly protein TadG